jgi:hypothetical protein
VKTLDSEIGAYEVEGVVTLRISNDDEQQQAWAEMNRDQLDELIAKLQRVRQDMD